MNRAGLTLIELMVALAITGLAMAAGYGAFGSIVDHRRRVEDASAAIASAAAERGTLISWLAGAHLTVEEGGPAFRGLDGVSGDSADDELTILTTAATPIGAGETIVRLYVDRDERTPERGLTAALAEWRGTATKRWEIDPRVTGLQIRYRSSLLSGAAWLPSWISTTVLPAGVEVTLAGEGVDTLPALLRLPIVVPLAGGR
ncbi:MAG TPA: prepilin-type N-terminal cleavage/methylation domain-containing protein [Gemmatimonadales bacterium]|nr:prepilin-type N-terminal cleavage/methylation domain-containing protein [Gemmatimonadales bacterium]